MRACLEPLLVARRRLWANHLALLTQQGPVTPPWIDTSAQQTLPAQHQRRSKFSESDAVREQANIVSQELKVASAQLEIFDRCVLDFWCQDCAPFFSEQTLL